MGEMAMEVRKFNAKPEKSRPSMDIKKTWYTKLQIPQEDQHITLLHICRGPAISPDSLVVDSDSVSSYVPRVTLFSFSACPGSRSVVQDDLELKEFCLALSPECFQVLVISSNVAMNIVEQVSFRYDCGVSQPVFPRECESAVFHGNGESACFTGMPMTDKHSLTPFLRAAEFGKWENMFTQKMLEDLLPKGTFITVLSSTSLLKGLTNWYRLSWKDDFSCSIPSIP
ncbi:hypothetical protein STEG23_000758 [Scotinomys teguina]